MLHRNRRLALVTTLVIGAGVLAAVGAGIHWGAAAVLFLG